MAVRASLLPVVWAVVPAAGVSRRFGSPKQLADSGGEPMLSATVRPLLTGGCSAAVIVTNGGLFDTVRGLFAGDPRVRIALNPDENAEMISSVRIGMRTATAESPQANGYLICPADHPGISPEDVARCIAAFCAAPDQITIATRDGVRGHPLILPAGLAEVVHSAACDDGLNRLRTAAACGVQYVACRSVGVSRDIDTPADCNEADNG